MAIVTQFAFEAGPVLAWASSLRAAGIALPIHLGVAGPASLRTLIRYAALCGVGPSARVLHSRAADVTKLLLPYEPTDLLADLAARRAADPAFPIDGIHLFPLGGVTEGAAWLSRHRGQPI